nr:unnamed protein product [Digitaria exilis]
MERSSSPAAGKKTRMTPHGFPLSEPSPDNPTRPVRSSPTAAAGQVLILRFSPLQSSPHVRPRAPRRRRPASSPRGPGREERKKILSLSQSRATPRARTEAVSPSSLLPPRAYPRRNPIPSLASFSPTKTRPLLEAYAIAAASMIPADSCAHLLPPTL